MLASSQWDLTSKKSGLEYRIFIAEPVGAPPKEGYAVVYILDGNGYFATAAEAERIQELGGEIDSALIVGIGYPVCECDPVGGMNDHQNPPRHRFHARGAAGKVGKNRRDKWAARPSEEPTAFTASSRRNSGRGWRRPIPSMWRIKR